MRSKNAMQMSLLFLGIAIYVVGAVLVMMPIADIVSGVMLHVGTIKLIKT